MQKIKICRYILLLDIFDCVKYKHNQKQKLNEFQGKFKKGKFLKKYKIERYQSSEQVHNHCRMPDFEQPFMNKD